MVSMLRISPDNGIRRHSRRLVRPEIVTLEESRDQVPDCVIYQTENKKKNS